MTPDQESEGRSGAQTQAIAYTKSDRCRTILVDGAWGGVAPDGSVYAALYTQQYVIPSEAIVEVDGTSGFATGEQSHPPEIGREVQVELRMTPQEARTLGNWFLGKAAEADKVQLDLLGRRTQAAADSASGTDGSR